MLSALVALLTCVAEAASQTGYDNLAIPFSALTALVISHTIVSEIYAVS